MPGNQDVGELADAIAQLLQRRERDRIMAAAAPLLVEPPAEAVDPRFGHVGNAVHIAVEGAFEQIVRAFNHRFIPRISNALQDPDDQLFSASVRDDLAFGPQNMGFDPAEVAARVAQAADMTGITHLLDRLPHHLSGGEKQMVAIAGPLAMTPQIMLYDEPTASLDLRTRRRLIRFLQNSSETALISSHDLEFVLEVCDRVILIDEGRMIADGCPKAIMGDRALMENHGLEKPHSLIPHGDPHHE